jgi:hypothetical protein
MATEKKYTSFRSFYPYYLTEHSDFTNRALHFTGTAGLLVIVAAAVVLQKWWMLALVPVCGYGFAWAGHFFIEKNKPATFTYPLYSLGSDFVMFWHILTGQIGKKLEAAKKTVG